MGRQKKEAVVKPKTTRKKISVYKCPICRKELRETEFYVSYSDIFSNTGRVPICKSCLRESCLDENRNINLANFHDILRQVDKPFILKLWQSSLNEAKKQVNLSISIDEYAIGMYWKNINSLPQYRRLFYRNSDDQNELNPIDDTADEYVKKFKNTLDDNEIIMSDSGDFEVTPEIIDLFGEGYKKIIYKKMFEKYEKLKLNYSLQTNLHQEALATYVRFKVQEELATANGKIDDAKKWYDAAQNAAEKAKLTPKQLTQADLQGGINSFSEIFKAVEQAVDVISILPRFKFRPNDALDFNIWCYINYARDLQGLPHCEYSDVYKFYDKKKKEYIEQYGDPYNIFEDDPCEKLRTNIQKFITLPKDYEDGDDND